MVTPSVWCSGEPCLYYQMLNSSLLATETIQVDDRPILRAQSFLQTEDEIAAVRL